MIVIDMDMPECWDDCRFNNGCECCLIDAVCTDETAGENGELPSFCPIKCDIEQIRAEIESIMPEYGGGTSWEEGRLVAFINVLKIIDRHIKEVRNDT